MTPDKLVVVTRLRPPSVRRLSTVVAAGATALVVPIVLAGPAAADVPVPGGGWEVAPSVSPLFVLGVLVGIPVLLTVVIAAMLYLPAMARGERVAPGAPALEDQWIGGPRKAAGELAAPDSEGSAAGGAGGRW